MPRLPTLVLLAATIASVSAWPQFMSLIPNTGAFEKGIVSLGHREGSILRNPFGLAFGVGRNWTKELCQTDSDNDGQTNGEELGDPCCVWTIGNDDALQRTTGISNPGNVSDLADPSLWEDIDCAKFEEKAAASAAKTEAPAATSSAVTPSAVGGMSVVLITSALALC